VGKEILFVRKCKEGNFLLVYALAFNLSYFVHACNKGISVFMNAGKAPVALLLQERRPFSLLAALKGYLFMNSGKGNFFMNGFKRNMYVCEFV
jgi:hypothetical protein